MTSIAEPSVVGEIDRYLGLYRAMVLIRGFEDLIQSLFLRGEIYGTTHLYTGQEAVAVGVASVLEERDRVAATYRGHGHALALGVDPQGVRRSQPPASSAGASMTCGTPESQSGSPRASIRTRSAATRARP